MQAPAMPSFAVVRREPLWTVADCCGYTTLVTSKKGVMRVWRPGEALRRKPQSSRRDCGFVIRAPSFRRLGWEARKGLPVLARASRFANPFEPPPLFGDRCVGCCKPKLLEAIHG